MEVRAYLCDENEAKLIQDRVLAFVKSVTDGTATLGAESKRKKVVYSNSDSKLRSVTFAFADTLNLNHEFGKLWYGNGWLFYFRCHEPLKIDSFPSKYLMEVGKQASQSAPTPKKGK